MIFGVLNSEKIWHQWLAHLPTSPVYCSHFTLGNPKSHFFNSIIHTHFRLYTLSHKKTNCYPLTHHTWKMSPHYLVKCKTFSSDWRYVAFLQILVALGWHWWLWKEPVVTCGKWNVRQATLQQTANVQSDHLLGGYMLPVFFATNQLHRLPRSAEFQPMSQEDASATRPYHGLVLDMHEKVKKDEKFVHFTR